MRNTLLITMLIFLFPSEGYSQRRPPVASPEFGDSGNVSFRIPAPDAKKVELVGQWPKGTTAMNKNVNGIWELVVDKIPPGVWEYSLRVDGVTMIDPNNSEIKPMRSPRSSIIHVAGNPPLIHDFQSVLHGTVHSHTYDSRASGRPRRMAVYIASLKSKGIEHQWHLTDGNHSWPLWRIYLSNFLPLLF